jgi:hypothetical protein
MTHNLGSPRPYRTVCREAPLDLPPRLRPWVFWAFLAAVAVLMSCTVNGW